MATCERVGDEVPLVVTPWDVVTEGVPVDELVLTCVPLRNCDVVWLIERDRVGVKDGDGDAVKVREPV